jgi:hypothetical protein
LRIIVKISEGNRNSFLKMKHSGTSGWHLPASTKLPALTEICEEVRKRTSKKSRRKDCEKIEQTGFFLSINLYKMEVILEEREDNAHYRFCSLLHAN